MFQIEKNIPMPNRFGVKEIPFKDMEVGDSLVIPKEIYGRTAISGKIREYTKTLQVEKVFTTRTEENGVRVWRIK